MIDTSIAQLTLADVSPSAAAALGVPGFEDRLGVGQARQVVLCLMDGLGWQALQAHADRAPTLAALSGSPIDAAFPTTTPVGLGSLGTGLPPGVHGLVGGAFEIPETGEVLSPLQWGSRPTPVSVQPEPTVFERVARAGVVMSTVAAGAYRESGLTRAVLRGGEYCPAEDLRTRVDIVRAILVRQQRSFTYVYWPDLDRVGHEWGVGSGPWLHALERVDRLAAGLVESLVPGAVLIVTADHGMVDCPPEEAVRIEEDPRLMSGVRRVAGEPRARHVYTKPGAAEDVAQAWSEVLGDRATVLARHRVVAEGLLGEVDPALADRVGDVMAIARGTTLLASTVDPRVSSLLGQHGALSGDEVLIPALRHRVD